MSQLSIESAQEDDFNDIYVNDDGKDGNNDEEEDDEFNIIFDDGKDGYNDPKFQKFLKDVLKPAFIELSRRGIFASNRFEDIPCCRTCGHGDRHEDVPYVFYNIQAVDMFSGELHLSHNFGEGNAAVKNKDIAMSVLLKYACVEWNRSDRNNIMIKAR